MSTGLKKELGLGDPRSAGSTEQADKFKAAFQAAAAKINECLQYTAAHAEKVKHDPQAAKRDTSCQAYQVALARIDPTNAAVAQGAIDQVLAGVESLKSSIESLKTAVEKAYTAWTNRQGELDSIADKIREMVDWGHDKASALQGVIDAIVAKANDRAYEAAITGLDQLLPKATPLYEEYLRQKEAQGEYDTAMQGLQPRLDHAKTCGYKVMEPGQHELHSMTNEMLSSADAKDFVTALSQLRLVEGKVNEFEARRADLDAKKQEYESARSALDPKLGEASTCQFKSLAEMDQQIADLTTRTDAAAAEEDYEQAVTLVGDLTTRVDEKLARAQDLEAKKAEYDTARGELDPRLAEASQRQYKTLADLEQPIADLTSQTDAAAAEEKFDEAVTLVGQLAAKVDDKLAKITELEAKKAEYEAAVQALQPKLPKTCPVNAKLSALDSEITTLKGQMETAAGSEDYAKALELAKQVGTKADEFQKALEEFEKNKQAYEAALKALQPKLPTQCPVNAGLAERHSQIMALKGQMEAAATSQDYAKALELVKQLTAKADEYQKALKEKPPSPEKVKEVQDLITAGKKDDAIKKAMEVYGVDKSQAKSIVYDSSVSGEAVASKDGSVKVGDKAFSSPGWLASSTAHELEVHVNQQAKAGKWYTGPMGTAIQEVQAYDHEIANAHKYNLTEAEIKELKKRRKEHYDLLNADYQKRANAGNYDMKTGEEGL